MDIQNVQNIVLIGIAVVIGIMFITSVALDQLSGEMKKEHKE